MFIYLLMSFLSTSTLFKLDQEEIFKKAEHIVTATVENIDCVVEKTSNHGRLPFSYITLKVLTVHYSFDNEIAENDEITIRQVSCKHSEDIELNIDGLAVFEKQSKVLLSLNRVKNLNFDSYFYVTGSEQGKLTFDSNDTVYSTSTASYVRSGTDGKVDYMAQDKGVKFQSLKNIIKIIKKVKGV